MAMYQVQSQGRPPRKRPSFGEAFRESFGGALGQALVNIPEQIGVDAASDAIGKRLGLHYGEGGKGWRGNMPEGEVSRYDALQALLVPKAELGMDLTRAQTEESRARSPLYGARTEGVLQDIGHKELKFPSELSQAMTAAERDQHVFGLLQADDPRVRIDQGVATYQDPLTGSRRAAGLIAPTTVPGPSRPAWPKLRNEFMKRLKDLRGVPVQKIRNPDGGERLVFAGTDAENLKYAAQLADLGQLADELQSADPAKAADFVSKMAQGGEAFEIQPGLSIWDALKLSKGAAQGGRARGIADVGMAGRTEYKPAVSAASPRDRIARPTMQAGQMRSQAVSAVKRISEARKAINGIAAATYLTDTMKANMTAQAQAEMVAATTDATNLNTSLTEMGVAPVAIPAAVK